MSVTAMSDQELKPMQWHNWTIFLLRWLFLFGICLAIYVSRSNDATIPSPTFDDLLIPVGIAAAINIMFGISVFVRQLNMASPFILIVGDWVVAGLFINLVNADPMFTLGIVTFLAATGLLNLGPIYGLFQATGVIAAALGLILITQDQQDLNLLIQPYGVPVIMMLMAALGIGGYVYARRQFGEGKMIELTREAASRAKQLDDMRLRARNIAEMTNELTGTIDFDKILNVALDIGQLSLRQNTNKRLISMVMLFRSSDDALYIASHRGLHNGTDTSRTIYGKSGIVGRTLEECVPTIGSDMGRDPELSQLGGLNTIRSILCIPLRARYDNYGILIYGSEERNAFNADHLDALYAIGVQATIALQNSVLYKDLMEEKERLIQMEEDARKSLVRDLHDIPTQTISAVAMRIRIIMRMMEKAPQDVPGELEAIEQMTLRATEEIRHVLFKLRPLALESRGLAAALDELAEKMQKTYKQNMKVKVGSDVEEYLDETQQGALFYLIEEAANNARKYAEASLISVQVVRKDTVLAIQIKDNGKGFETEGIEGRSADQGSFGMTNMRERAELLDGTLSIKSAPGQGTTITVMIPLDLGKTQASENGYVAENVPMTKLAASARSLSRL